ncbi:competence type IV pilus minor pilin ComGG [Fictibacillus iocasae]|uniref:Competence type IV pilus minor pilin ComGG n=1 Tax=Fictibacillus iocasae TaxID=2715437 RepID=A0ABW2NMJ2_9BACL
MKQNEKGFVYPIILIICFALFYTVMAASDMMAAERKFVRQKERLSEENQLLQAGAQFAILRINGTETLTYPAELLFSHKNMSIVCYIETRDSLMFSVLITSESSAGRKRKARFTYEKSSHKLTDWTEEKR